MQRWLGEGSFGQYSCEIVAQWIDIREIGASSAVTKVLGKCLVLLV